MAIRDIQLAELEMLTDIRDFCDRHGLRFTLYCGTLLGAVRHKGFIPWDDDTDIAMPLRDYRRFAELFPKEMEGKYRFITYKNDRYSAMTWIRVNKPGTTNMNPELLPYAEHQELYLDIYPFIGAADHPKLERIQSFLIRTCYTLSKSDSRRTLGLTPVDAPPWAIRAVPYVDRLPYPFRRFLISLFLWLTMLDPDKHERCGTIDAALFQGKYRWRDWDELIPGSFEGREFPIPKNYDTFLRAMYGDYMTPPPVEARHGHTGPDGSRVLDPFRSYEEYRNDYFKKEGKP